MKNLSLSAFVAEDDDGINQDWDATDSVFFEYQIDEGGYSKTLQFASQGSTNTEPGLDIDFDDIQNGIPLTDVFTTFSNSIVGTGSTLDLRVDFDLNAGQEDIAIDNITISGDATAAVPFEFSPTLGLLFVGSIIGFKKLRTK